MSRVGAHHLLLIIVLLFAVVLIAQSADVSVQAEPAATLMPRAYLPFLHGPGQAPPATATFTPTATNTPPPTNTPEPGRLASPVLFDIINADQDGDFAVGWSTVPNAEYYKLEQIRNNNSWKQIYEGPQQEFDLTDLADGQYCYRVMAVSSITDSGWSGIKCTTVITTTGTPGPEGLTPPVLYDIANGDGNGNFDVKWSAVAEADEYILKEAFNDSPPNDTIIYRGPNTSFGRSYLAKGQYCYRVRAIILGGEWGPWSENKCTSVTIPPPATNTPTATPTGVYKLPEHYMNVYTQADSNAYISDPDETPNRVTTSIGLGYGYSDEYDTRVEMSSDEGKTWDFVALFIGYSDNELIWTNPDPGIWCFRMRYELGGGSIATGPWTEECAQVYAPQCPPSIKEAYYSAGYLKIDWQYSCPNADFYTFEVFSNYNRPNYYYLRSEIVTTETLFEEYGYKDTGTWLYRVCARSTWDTSGYACSDVSINMK